LAIGLRGEIYPKNYLEILCIICKIRDQAYANQENSDNVIYIAYMIPDGLDNTDRKSEEKGKRTGKEDYPPT
jgi:hypothetical protein